MKSLTCVTRRADLEKFLCDKIGSHLSPAWGQRSESSEKYLESHLSIEKNIRGRVKKKETDLQCYTHYVKQNTESSVKIVKNILRWRCDKTRYTMYNRHFLISSRKCSLHFHQNQKFIDSVIS